MQFTRKTDLLVFQPLHLLTIGYITVQEECIGFKLLFVFILFIFLICLFIYLFALFAVYGLVFPQRLHSTNGAPLYDKVHFVLSESALYI